MMKPSEMQTILDETARTYGATYRLRNALADAIGQIRPLEAENEALREYALGLMANSYHGMGKEERKLILESELIALLTREQGQVLDRS